MAAPVSLPPPPLRYHHARPLPPFLPPFPAYLVHIAQCERGDARETSSFSHRWKRAHVDSPAPALTHVLHPLATPALNVMAGNCPCCPPTTEPRAVPLTPAAAVPLTPADRLWTSSRDQAVMLRLEGSGPGSEAPLTVHQMLQETAERFADHPALAFKRDGCWATVTWRQHYQQCRAAAKSFLKVRHGVFGQEPVSQQEAIHTMHYCAF